MADRPRALRHLRPAWRRAAYLAAVAVMLPACFGWLLGAFDLEAFLHAGRLALDGRSVYPGVHSATFRSGHAFVYPYLVAWAFVPLAVLPVPVAVGVYSVLSAVGIVAGTRLLGRPVGLAGALVLASSTTIVGLQMGTVNAPLFLLLAAAWASRRRWAWAGLLVGVLAALKLFLVPMIGWLVLGRRWAAAGTAAAVLGAVLGAGWAFGSLGLPAYVSLLGSLEANESARSWSLSSLLHSLGVTPSAAHAGAVVIAGAVLLGGFLLARRRSDERVLYSAAVLACLLSTPILWSSYLLIAAVPVVLLADERAVAVLGLATWVLVIPDAASGARVAAGVGLEAVLAAAAFASPGGAGGRPGSWPLSFPALGDRRRAALAAAGAAAAAGVLVAVPAPVRNALPTVMLLAAIGLWVERRSASAAQGSGVEPVTPAGCPQAPATAAARASVSRP